VRPVASLDYPELVKPVSGRLRASPQLADAALAALLLGVSVIVSALAGQEAAIAVSAALAGAVAVRRRFPVAALAATLLLGTAQLIAGAAGPVTAHRAMQPTVADLAILVLLYTVSVSRSRPVSLAGLAACVVLSVAAVTRLNHGLALAGRPLTFVLLSATYALVPVCVWVIGDSIAHRREYLGALQERAVRAEAERDAHAQLATAAERARIARELHDVIAHNLSVMVAQADGGRYAFDAEPERSRQALAEIGSTGRQALSEMSQLLGVLKSGEEAPLFVPTPGVAEIAELVAQAREAGTSVRYEVEGAAPPVPAGISLALYRIAQEALTNVRKHAGLGAAAAVTLTYRPDEAVISVADDGGGYDSGGRSAPAGHGLAGMRDRVSLHGGTLDAGPRAEGGFAIAARLPLPAAASLNGGHG
jgi:signal transduction histidine kinase